MRERYVNGEYVEIELDQSEIELGHVSGYDAVGSFIKRYWDNHRTAPVVVRIGTSFDGMKFVIGNEVADPYLFEDVMFDYDWWEGERFIRIYGIRPLCDIEVYGGIEEEN